MLDLTKFTTEQRNQRSMDLDTMTSLQIVTTMNDEDLRAVQSVTKVLPQVATAIDWAAETLERGGRVFYMGAGTSGRLGVLDASECPPTFGVSPDLVVGLIAGGETAFIKAVEGAEDSEELGASDLRERGLSDNGSCRWPGGKRSYSLCGGRPCVRQGNWVQDHCNRLQPRVEDRGERRSCH